MMSKNLDKIKNQYENERILPSAELWSKLENKLDSSLDLGENKRNFSWLKYAAVVLLLVSITSLIIWNLSIPVQTNFVKISKPETKTINADQSKEVEELSIKKIVAGKREENTNILNRPTKKTIPEEKYLTHNLSEEVVLVSKEISPIKANENFVTDIKISENSHPKVIAEVKETKYINSSELLMGAELDKTRQEQNLNSKKLGTLDLSKIKLKPKSFQILGKSVVSDSARIK